MDCLISQLAYPAAFYHDFFQPWNACIKNISPIFMIIALQYHCAIIALLTQIMHQPHYCECFLISTEPSMKYKKCFSKKCINVCCCNHGDISYTFYALAKPELKSGKLVCTSPNKPQVKQINLYLKQHSIGPFVRVNQNHALNR